MTDKQYKLRKITKKSQHLH